MNVNIPKRRFKGFSEDWEQCKFEKLLDYDDGIRRGPFGSALKKEYFVQNSDYVVYEQNNAISNHFKTRYKITEEKFKELHKFELLPGDFIMSGAGTIGRVSLVPPNISRGVINQALIRIRLNETTDSGYFLEWIMSPKMQRKLTESNPGSAMVNLVPMRELKNWKVRIPTVKEQIKISRLLNTLQKTISLHKRKLEKLKQLQKSYLSESVFSETKCVPKRRFKGFVEPWEQKKLKNVVITNPYEELPEKFNYVNLESVLGTSLISYECTNIENAPSRAQRLAKKGDIFFQNVRPYQKNNLLFNLDCSNYVFSTGYTQLRPKLNSGFLFSIIQKDKFVNKVLNRCTGSSYPAISSKDLVDIKVNISRNIEEQNKIADFIGTIDKLLTLHKHKHNAIKILQKIYLQNNLEDETYA